MVEIAPFKGIIYNNKKIKNLNDVMSPPYDIISEDMQNELYNKNEYNFVKLILGKIFSDDTSINNRYTRAKQLFDTWEKQEILIPSSVPAIYPYKIDISLMKTAAGEFLGEHDFSAFAQGAVKNPTSTIFRLDIFEDAETLSKELGDKETLAWFYGALGSYHSLKGNPTLGLEYSLRMMEYSEKSFIEDEKIEAIQSIVESAFMVCNAHNSAGDYLKVVDIASRVLHLLEERHRERDLISMGFNAYSTLSGYCGSALAFLGKLEEGRAVLDKEQKRLG
jgi:hypothetical protein